MAPNILPLDKLHPQSRNFTIQCMLTEKAIPRQSADSSSHYQRLVFQDAQGNKMQGIIYGDSIEIFAKRLKVYHTYVITNAVITRIKERFRFLPNIYQIVVNAKTPVEHIEVDGLSIRTLVYNFTPITALHTVQQVDPQLDVLFAILEVGERRKARGSYVVDLFIIDKGMVVSTISLWDQFSEYEAVEMAKLRGNFPIAIGLRLKLSRYYGLGFATRGSSGFILNPPIPEAIELQSWCSANSSSIRELPYPTITGGQALIHNPTHPNKVVKIVNLPTSIDNKVEYLNVQGDIEVTDFNQKFIYLACSICNRSTNAYGDNDFWCNYCNKKVAPLPKAKLNVQITDDTGSIGATIFTEKAEALYNVTATELAQHTSAGNLPISLIEKLSAPKKHYMSLKASMYDYGGINRCVFNIDSVSEPINAEELLQIEPSQEQQSQPQPPKTPSKRAQGEGSKITSTTYCTGMEDDEFEQPLKHRQKKE